MQFPQVAPPPDLVPGITASNIEQLTAFHANKNRHYTQLETGQLSARLLEANLGKAHLMRESLSHSTLIQAAPGPQFLPFGSILSASSNNLFCGLQSPSGALIQATGGNWELSSHGALTFIACVFSRDYFFEQYQKLYACDVPTQVLRNTIPKPHRLNQEFAQQLQTTLLWIKYHPEVFNHHKVVSLLCAQLVQLISEQLPHSDASSLPSPPKRILAAKRAIDYLQAHACELPDIATLCQVTGVSERSLQSGFAQYLGVTPVQYIRLIRLNAARRELISARGSCERVSNIALRWGFIEFGRFSRDYKALFCEQPSQTLKGTGR